MCWWREVRSASAGAARFSDADSQRVRSLFSGAAGLPGTEPLRVRSRDACFVSVKNASRSWKVSEEASGLGVADSLSRSSLVNPVPL